MSANILSNNGVFPEEEDDATVINPAPEGCPTATTIQAVQSDADFSASENDDDEWDPLIPQDGFTPLPSIPEEQPPHIPIGPNAGWFCHICGYDNLLVDHLVCRTCGRPPDARDLKETPDITLDQPLLEDVPPTVEVWQCGGCSTMNDFIPGQGVHTCVQCQRVADSTSEVFLSFSIPEEDYVDILAQRKKPWGQPSAVPFGGGLVRPTGPPMSWESHLASQNTSFTAQTPSNNCFNSKWQSDEVASPASSQQWPSFSPPPVDVNIDFFGCDTPEPLPVEDPVVDPAVEQPSSLLTRPPFSWAVPDEGEPSAEAPTTMDEDACDLLKKRGLENVMGNEEDAGETEPPKKKRRVAPLPIDASETAGECDADVDSSGGGDLEGTPQDVYQTGDQNTTEKDVNPFSFRIRTRDECYDSQNIDHGHR